MIWFGGKRPSFDHYDGLSANTLMAQLGIEMDECGDDYLRMRMPVDTRTHQPMGRLHGGASVALAETVGSIAAGNCVDLECEVVVGVEINANHVRPAFDGWVYATARPESLGRTLQIWSIRIENAQGKLVCICRFTAAVIARERG